MSAENGFNPELSRERYLYLPGIDPDLHAAGTLIIFEALEQPDFTIHSHMIRGVKINALATIREKSDFESAIINTAALKLIYAGILSAEKSDSKLDRPDNLVLHLEVLKKEYFRSIRNVLQRRKSQLPEIRTA